MKVLLDSNKKFFKANLHNHTNLSDGTLTPEEIKKEYMEKGYSIVAFSDHDHVLVHKYLDDENFLAITSAEIAIKEVPEVSSLVKQDMMVTHLNIFAFDQDNDITPCYERRYDRHTNDEILARTKHEGEYLRRFEPDGINEMIRIFHEKGWLVSYNHPSWSLEDATRYLALEGIDIIEIYNNSCMLGERNDDEHVMDDFLRHDKKVYCMCADDNHERRSQFGGWVQINADKLEYKTIMNALKDGEFYASTGPEIYSLTKNGYEVEITCSPAEKISLAVKTRRACVVKGENGEEITKAKFTLRHEDKYFRIRVHGKNGKKAFTQSYDVEL